MNYTKILLDIRTCDEERQKVITNIITTCNFALTTEQILLAYDEIRKRKLYQWEEHIHTLLNTLLNINKNMYVAIILALCNKLYPLNLINLLNFDIVSLSFVSGIGKNDNNLYSSFQLCCELLNYYEFDVSNIQHIPEEYKQLIQEYRFNIYSGKLTKCANKK